MYPFFLTTAVVCFFVRWVLNWRILNKQNNTNFVVFSASQLQNDYYRFVKHTIVSEWTLVWITADTRLKVISNIMSALTVVSVIGTLVAFKYK